MEQVLANPHPSRGELMRLVVLLSLPGIMAEISGVATEYIDTAMVGSLGASASAAVGLVASSTWLAGGLCTAASMGFSVQVAQLVGAGRDAEARNMVRQSLVVLGIFSLVLAFIGAILSGGLPVWLGGEPDVCPMASQYFFIFALALPAVQAIRLCTSLLQCSGDMRTPSVLNILMCILDVLFNLVLIFPSHPLNLMGPTITLPGADLGVAGAALGTALAEVVTASLLLWAVCVRSEKLALIGHCVPRTPSDQTAPPCPASWRPQARCLTTATRIAGPICLERIVMNGAQIVSTAIVAPLGTAAMAAHALAITAEGLCYMPGFGISAAATTLVGQSFGANRRDLAQRMAWASTFLGMAMMGCTGTLMYAFASPLMGLFTPDATVRTLGASVLRIEAFAEPLFAASIVVMGALRGAGDTMVPTLINLGTVWGVRITLALFLVPAMGLYGVWIAMLIELCLRGILFLVRLARGTWLRRQALIE